MRMTCPTLLTCPGWARRSAIPKVTADGIYGSATAAAVRSFQNIFGLPATGVADFPTWYAISRIYVGVTRIAEPS